MTHSVLLFARARQLAGQQLLEVELPEGASVADLKRAIAAACPALEPLLARVRIAVDAAYATDDQAVPPAAELAVIPPVSGGAGSTYR
jgi:molybdopterin converting factor subunit 1